MTRYQQRDRVIVLLAASVLFATGAVAALSVATGFSPIQLATFPWAPRYLELCDETFVGALERIRAETGAYPQSVDRLGLAPSKTFYGPWRYRPINSGRSCEIAVGDYGRYGFQLSWTPERGWYLDT